MNQAPKINPMKQSVTQKEASKLVNDLINKVTPATGVRTGLQLSEINTHLTALMCKDYPGIAPIIPRTKLPQSNIAPALMCKELHEWALKSPEFSTFKATLQLKSIYTQTLPHSRVLKILGNDIHCTNDFYYINQIVKQMPKIFQIALRSLNYQKFGILTSYMDRGTGIQDFRYCGHKVKLVPVLTSKTQYQFIVEDLAYTTNFTKVEKEHHYAIREQILKVLEHIVLNSNIFESGHRDHGTVYATIYSNKALAQLNEEPIVPTDDLEGFILQLNQECDELSTRHSEITKQIDQLKKEAMAITEKIGVNGGRITDLRQAQAVIRAIKRQ